MVQQNPDFIVLLNGIKPGELPGRIGSVKPGNREPNPNREKAHELETGKPGELENRRPRTTKFENTDTQTHTQPANREKKLTGQMDSKEVTTKGNANTKGKTS